MMGMEREPQQELQQELQQPQMARRRHRRRKKKSSTSSTVSQEQRPVGTSVGISGTASGSLVPSLVLLLPQAEETSVEQALLKLRRTIAFVRDAFAVDVSWRRPRDLAQHTQQMIRATPQLVVEGPPMEPVEPVEPVEYAPETLLAVGCFAPATRAGRQQTTPHLYLAQHLLDLLMSGASHDAPQIVRTAERLSSLLPALAARLAVQGMQQEVGRFVVTARRSGVTLDDYLGNAGAIPCGACVREQQREREQTQQPPRYRQRYDYLPVR